MRGLKFRVWDGKGFTYSKDLAYIGLEEKDEKFKMLHQIGFLFCSQIVNHKNLEEIIPQQFTGLEDKNGVEIYEGDIVKYPQDSGIPDAYDVMSVEWDLDCDGFGGLHCGFRIGGDYARWNNTEVIGNIFENSDLLK